MCVFLEKDYLTLCHILVTVSYTLLGNNQLEGSMPSTLGNITSLEYLEIGES